MRLRGGILASLAAGLVALAVVPSAWAHAALLKTVPVASGVVNTPPREVALTYSEPVEPRFAVISVTDAGGRQQVIGAPRRSPTDVNTLLVPLRQVPEGWYLVYWRVISVDGHPVRGAFTFAVGPNPGPAPQFVIPSTSETAATPRLVVTRWIVFLSVMAAIGLFVLRIGIARPVVRRVDGTNLRAVSIAFFVAAAVALVATPFYVLLATADFAVRPLSDLGGLVPLLRVSAFGRGWLDLELCFGLFVVAAAIAIWVDRPERTTRSIAELLAYVGAIAAAGAVVLVPGAAGHAAQTSPRGLSLLFDWLHVAAGSLWVGGLFGLLVLWRSLPVARRVAGLAIAVPRFSNVALVSVIVLVASGVGASIIHLPTLASLWSTSYGQTIVVKVLLLLGAIVVASLNLLQTKPRLVAARQRPDIGRSAAKALRVFVGGEVVFVVAAILAAAVLSSLAPPSKALAAAGRAAAKVGPGRVTQVVNRNGYRLEFRVAPNRAAVPNSFAVRITRDGVPVRDANVNMSFAMLDMEMGQQAYHLTETQPGVYSRAAPALVMVGHWGLEYEIEPRGRAPFDVVLVDHATG